MIEYYIKYLYSQVIILEYLLNWVHIQYFIQYYDCHIGAGKILGYPVGNGYIEY